jgi:hypothetical protein
VLSRWSGSARDALGAAYGALPIDLEVLEYDEGFCADLDSATKHCYIVPADAPAALLDAVFADCYERWGGRDTILLPFREGSIDDRYWAWGRAFDPDLVYSYIPYDDALLERIGKETLTMVESSVSSSEASITATTIRRRRTPYSTTGRPSRTVAAEYSTIRLLNTDLCSQSSIDCWAKIPAIAPCDDATVTEGKKGVVRSPAA